MKGIPKKLDLKQIRIKAEDLCKYKTINIIKEYSDGDVNKLIHELEVHQIELEMINEELLASKQREIDLATNKYANLYDFAPSGYFTLSKTGKITSLNFSAADMLGKERQYLINNNFSLYVAENSKKAYRSFIDNVYKSNTKETCELTLKSASNEFLYVYLSGITPAQNKELLLTAVDITKLKSYEKELLKNDEELRKIQKITRVGSWSLDIATNKVVWSDELYKMYGFDSTLELPPLDEHKKLFTSESWETLTNAMANTSITGDPYELELEMIKSDGSVGWMWAQGEARYSDEGKIIGLWGAAQDITNHKNSEESLIKLKKAINFTSICKFMTDMDGVITFINPAFTKLYGYTAEEIIGKTTPRILKSGLLDQNTYTRFWNTLLSKKSVEAVEFINKTKDGKLIEVEATADPILDENNNVIGFIGMHRDITERKKAATVQNILLNISNNVSMNVDFENFIKIIQHELGRLVDTSNFFIAIYNEKTDTVSLPFYQDEKGNVTEFPLNNTLTGHVIKKGQSLLINKQEMERIDLEHKFHKIGVNAEIWLGVPLKIKEKVIGALVVQSYTNPNAYTEKDKEILEIISQQISISIKLKQQEDELLKAKDLLNETGHIAKVGGWEIDLVDNTLTWTAETFQIHELSSENQPNVADAINFYHPDDRDMVALVVEKAIRTGLPYDFEARLITKKGNLIWVRSSGKAVLQNEKIMGVRGSIQDITERKQTEIELIEAKEHAEESDRLKSAFLANMSHEIRTPMNGILGFSELLKNPELKSEKQAKYINIIDKSSRRLLNTINDIIDISKIEAGQVVVSYSAINIPRMLEELFEFFKPEAEKKALKLELRCSLTDELNDIKTDVKLLNSILVNLIKNAIKFTEKGVIKFGCTIINNAIQFFVDDTGIGIPEDRQQRVFDRFVQADIEDKEVHQGSGLGLTIAKSYVEILGGQLKLASIVGKGSQFSFTLPLVNGTAKTVGFQNKQVIPAQKTAFKKLKILIAEDEEMAVIYLTEILADKFEEILIATNGLEALELIKKNPDIDLILMDVKLPLMNGLEVTKQIRAFNKDVVIIAQTAYAMSGDRTIALHAGCHDYISKPINKQLLFEMINNYFHKEIVK